MNPYFNMLSGRPQNAPETAPTLQTGIAPQTDFRTAMSQLQANPGQLAKQAGYQIPEGMNGDPQAMVMHLIRSGQVGGPMMRMITPMLQRMGIKI